MATALGAQKLIFLPDAPGMLSDGEVPQPAHRDRPRAAARRRSGAAGETSPKAQAILTALAGGVQRVHVLDGRMPHGIIAELFTDHGVGTLVTAG